MSVTPEQWALAKSLFGEAIELAPSERAALLDARAGDPAVRAEVESLLASHDAAGSFIDVPALLPSAPAGEPREGALIGPYRLERRLGQGGMGAVYLAARADDAFRKRVALKIIKRGMDTDEIVARFMRERQTLANLDHPNIARLLDGGATPDGRPYFVMEYVEGEPLIAYCRGRALPAADRLRLFRAVCGAVQFAHSNLVVHRDLKPDNILVTSDGVPKLLDFGIAKLIGPGTAAETRPAARLLTLEYASPEQIRGEPISTATDVFALGVMLYELLSESHPFRRPGRTARELESAICDEDPPPPGQGEVDLIVMKAMRKEPSRRYRSASELDDDIRRSLEGLPITAHADTLGYRARKFVARHAGAVGAATVLVAALVAGLVGVTWQARVAQAERDRARVEADKAQRVSALLEQMLRAADPSVDGRQVTVASVLAQASRRADVELTGRPDVEAAVRTAIGNTYYGLGLNAEAIRELETALRLSTDAHGEDAVETADIGTKLGAARLAEGDASAAESAFAAALASVERGAAGDAAAGHASGDAAEGNIRWRALNGLGLVAAARGDADAAGARYREALGIARALYGDTDVRVAEITNNLAVQAHARGDLAEAERLYREALRITRELQGERLPGYAAGLSNLANVLHSQGRLADARVEYERALALRLDLLGADHPDVAFTEVNYSLLLGEMGEHAAARDMADRALGRRGASLPDGHPIVAAAVLARGQARLALGDAAGAERDVRDALARRRAMLPAAHWLIASTESLLGECLLALGRAREAEPLLVGAHDRLLASRGAEHERTRDARRRLARLYDTTGRPALAARYR